MPSRHSYEESQQPEAVQEPGVVHQNLPVQGAPTLNVLQSVATPEPPEPLEPPELPEPLEPPEPPVPMLGSEVPPQAAYSDMAGNAPTAIHPRTHFLQAECISELPR